MRPLAKHAALVLLVLAPAGTAAEWWVDAGNPNCPGDGSPENPFCLIQDAVDAAADGDTIRVRPGVYTNSGTWLIRHKRLRLIATGDRETTILELGRPILRIVDSTHTYIRGLTLRGGFTGPPGGSALQIEGSTVFVEGCRFVSGEADISAGGAVSALTSDLHLVGCQFTANRAAFLGGAVYLSQSELLAESCLFQGNSVGIRAGGGAGGAVAAQSSNCGLRRLFFHR